MSHSTHNSCHLIEDESFRQSIGLVLTTKQVQGMILGLVVQNAWFMFSSLALISRPLTTVGPTVNYCVVLLFLGSLCVVHRQQLMYMRLSQVQISQLYFNQSCAYVQLTAHYIFALLAWYIKSNPLLHSPDPLKMLLFNGTELMLFWTQSDHAMIMRNTLT